MQHQIYPDRFNDDGEFVPAVIVEVPDILYLQVVDEGDCEDWPAPSEPDERTYCNERINASDVAYVPLARAELAEARAGQQWRPGREPRPGAGWYLAYDFSQDDRPLYWYDNGNGESNPDWWMPIPPLPAAPGDGGEEAG